MIGIMGALQEEIDLFETSLTDRSEVEIFGLKFTIGKLYGKDVVVSLCGVGKVNAAMAATVLLTKFNVKMIFSSGTAGGIGSEKATTVIASSTVHHDFSIPFEGKKPGQLDEYDFIELPCSAELRDKAIEISRKLGFSYSSGVIATGDSFVSDKQTKNRILEQFNAKACDMESAAIAQICYKADVPFLSIRTLSDNANDDGITDYLTFKREAALKNSKLIIEMIKSL